MSAIEPTDKFDWTEMSYQKPVPCKPLLIVTANTITPAMFVYGKFLTPSFVWYSVADVSHWAYYPLGPGEHVEKPKTGGFQIGNRICVWNGKQNVMVDAEEEK